MQRTRRIQPLSLIVGVLLAGVVFVSMSQHVTSTTPVFQFQYDPHPRDMVTIVEGTPFVVPTGKVFVVTALGTTGWTGPSYVSDAVLEVNGQMALRSTRGMGGSSGYGHHETSISPVPSALSVAAGQTIDVAAGSFGPTSSARALGYLADAQATRAVLVEYRPNASDMVQISEGTPLLVPAGKVFVLTGLGASDWCGSPTLTVNGQPAIQSDLEIGVETFGDESASVARVPLGFSVPSGSTVDVMLPGTQCGRAWGYLAPQ